MDGVRGLGDGVGGERVGAGGGGLRGCPSNKNYKFKNLKQINKSH